MNDTEITYVVQKWSGTRFCEIVFREQQEFIRDVLQNINEMILYDSRWYDSNRHRITTGIIVEWCYIDNVESILNSMGWKREKLLEL